jgi:hypothetical protein
MWVVKVISSAVAMETVPPAARSLSSPSASSGSMAAVTGAFDLDEPLAIERGAPVLAEAAERRAAVLPPETGAQRVQLGLGWQGRLLGAAKLPCPS